MMIKAKDSSSPFVNIDIDGKGCRGNCSDGEKEGAALMGYIAGWSDERLSEIQ